MCRLTWLWRYPAVTFASLVAEEAEDESDEGDEGSSAPAPPPDWPAGPAPPMPSNGAVKALVRAHLAHARQTQVRWTMRGEIHLLGSL